MRYKDQLLEFHRISRRKFELSGLRTGSIRDQLLRAYLVVKRLALDVELIGPDPNQRLLIAGGGAAGACAALTASALGVDVVLVEEAPGKRLFERQAVVTTRFIDPIEYDWPHPHWRPTTPGAISCWPLRQSDVPIPLIMEAKFASSLAVDWQIAFDSWPTTCPVTGARHGQIDVRDGVNARNLLHKEVSDAVVVHGLSVGAEERFGAMLSCIGFRGEKVGIEGYSKTQYKGYEFWQDDPFDDYQFGVPVGTKMPVRVLISGAGDGALQDYQRFLTGLCGRTLYEQLESLAGKHWLEPTELFEMLAADDCGKRAHAWRSAKSRLATDLAVWHARIDRVAKRICDDLAAGGKLPHIANKVLKRDVHATLLLRHGIPDYCYGLNRFLTCMLLRLVRAQTKRPFFFDASQPLNLASDPQIIAGHVISEISCAVAGVSLSVPDSSHGHTKVVEVAPANVKKRDIKKASFLLGEYQIIVVRHGVDAKPLFRGGARVPEQLTPYEAPT